MSTAARTGAVRFLHYSDTGNIGDYLCSPRHYFDFASDRSVLIVGGGASNNFFCGRARKQRADVRIAWGIGQSWTLGDDASPLDRLIKAAKRRLTYTKASTRDPLLAFDQLPLVPCVSVFHPVTEIAPGTDVGIFVNAHEQVSGVWNLAVAARVRTAFAATGRPHAGMTADRLAERITPASISNQQSKIRNLLTTLRLLAANLLPKGRLVVGDS